MSLYSRQERDHMQGTPDAFVFPVGGRYVALEHKIAAAKEWRRRERWLTILAVIATVGAVVCVAVAVIGVPG